MPSLHILKGANEGTFIPLDGDVVLGRNPDCDIVIPMTSVSREHAQIVRVNGRYHIEDKNSRNHTYLNNQEVKARTPLKNNDRIRICDWLAAFVDQVPAQEEDEDDEGNSTSTVEATVGHSSHMLLETQPADKLRGLLEISGNLNKTLQLDALLPKIVDSLFQFFRQADRCFLIQAEEGTDRLLPRVVKTRRPHDESTARFSKSIVRRCLESSQAFLIDDAGKAFQTSQSVVDFRIRSVMCAPLCGADGQAFGVILVDTQDRTKKFTQDDLKLLCGVANQAAIAVENARLHEDAVMRAKIKRDLELAHQVQLSFLPRHLPQVPGYDFYAHYESALEVGGDYYGFVPLPEGKLALALGDVAGKGVPAALLMAKLSSDTRLSLLTEPDPARAISKLNDLLYEFTSQVDRFVTLALVVLDPATHQVILVNAGHLSPLLLRPGSPPRDAMPNEKAGVPLGIMEGYPFESWPVELQPGDNLLLYTDGVPDSLNVRGESFGIKGIEAALKDPGSPRVLIERLMKAVHEHATGRPAFDDITLICLGRTQ